MLMNDDTWPKATRPREKLLRQGCGALSDAELLAILLNTGIPGKNVVTLAQDLLYKYKGLRGLLSDGLGHLKGEPGIGRAKLCRLQAILELGRRYFEEPLIRRGVVECIEDTRHYLLAQLIPHEQEVFACLFLDTRQRLIAFEKLFYGTVNQANVYPREVVKRALYHNASLVIAAHNHPSGNPEPSLADLDLTDELKQALLLMDIRLLDHLIIAGNQVVSLAHRGIL